MSMRLLFISIMAAAAALFATPVQAVPAPEDNPRIEVDPSLASRDIVAETEHFCLTLALFFEGGSTLEPEVGQRHIARVIMERAQANRRIWGGPTICGVVFYQAKGVCQFSFACLPQARRTPRFGALWHVSAAIARDALEGQNPDTDRLIRYYMNEELTPLRNACRFRREFVPVVKAGRHEFFREPTRAERKELAQTEFEACTRYEASLKAKSAKAKKAAAKKVIAKRKGTKDPRVAAKASPKSAARTKLARLKK
jgi:hypothetical protein